jgi:hypothetical protein
MENKDNIESPKEEPKETTKEYAKRYYKEHREKHLAYVNAKIPCEICNSSYSRVRTKQHMNSKKHIDNNKMIEVKKELQQVKLALEAVHQQTPK